MGRQKRVNLQLTDGKALVMHRGTEQVKGLPDTFEISVDGDGFRYTVVLMKVKSGKITQFKADLGVEFSEDIKCWDK